MNDSAKAVYRKLRYGKANDNFDGRVSAEMASIMLGDESDERHTCPERCIVCDAWEMVRQLVV